MIDPNITGKDREIANLVMQQILTIKSDFPAVADLLDTLLEIAFPDPAISDFETGEYMHEWTARSALEKYLEGVKQ